MSKDTRLCRIADIALAAGILPSKVRFYSNQGLLHIHSISSGNQRLYRMDTTLETINRIRELKASGKSIVEIREALWPSCSAVAERAGAGLTAGD